MVAKVIKFVFFGNYFIGILAVALSLETMIQLRLSHNTIPYYTLLFCGTVMYYTYAYSNVLQSNSSGNLRSAWYWQHRALVRFSQWILLAACLTLGGLLLFQYYRNISYLSFGDWLVMAITGTAGLLYYGLVGKPRLNLNLRNTGWLKAFVIGFVWAACVTVVPVIALKLERGFFVVNDILLMGLFVKNWMFCTVNAILFDLKDYEDDSNKQLKTFVVSFGLRKTIFFVLMPLCLVGICFIFMFANYRHFSWLPLLFNLLPFLLLLLTSFSMQRERNIFFYLVVIDGLVLLKAICGIVAMAFVLN